VIKQKSLSSNAIIIMKIYYGAKGVYERVRYPLNLKFIPASDFERASTFGFDPLPGEEKEVRIEHGDGSEEVVPMGATWGVDPQTVLSGLHARLSLEGGSFREEYPEQMMAAAFVHEHSVVLEIGANIGRNSCVIAALLKDSSNLVALECDKVSAAILARNRDRNGLNFAIVPKALSSVPLAQKGWDTRRGLPTEKGWNEVDTLMLDELRISTGKQFNTLVLDCEGAFIHILRDFPDVLNGIHTIIMENDYWSADEKTELDERLTAQNFTMVYSRPLPGGWGPCANFFFQTWQRVLE
jgi:FkbM family methyltransferase